MKCPNCGKEIAKDSAFCEFCGSQIKRPGNHKVIWMVTVVCLLIALLGGLAYYQQNEEKQPGPSNLKSCYTGSIGGSSVTMYINTNVISGKVGYYYYNKYKKSIDLYINAYDDNGDGTVEYELSEYTAGHGQTGVFRITVYPSHSIRGSFVNSKGQYFNVNLR